MRIQESGDRTQNSTGVLLILSSASHSHTALWPLASWSTRLLGKRVVEYTFTEIALPKSHLSFGDSRNN
jgi:hypothetical protein